MNDFGNFGRCNKCMTLNWDSPIYMRTHGLTGCRKCGANETRWPGKISLFERLYLLRWYLWETQMFNREFEEGDPDPNWWVNPMNVFRTIGRGLHPDLGFLKPADLPEAFDASRIDAVAIDDGSDEVREYHPSTEYSLGGEADGSAIAQEPS